ncbi:ribonuclease H-like domain-containing protein [Auriculariales sp. MPI-PUGE-AT-0066]|nr:ribonuclease H-like domain-containing protein [Auriculariales sp. MPI-PUGE-AT-0066]
MWCTSASTVQYAVSQLEACPHIIVDCEGRDLGRASGALSIICVGTHDAKSIFIFDVLRLTAAARQPLADLLASEEQPKLVWDGRMDAIELQREFGIKFGRPWDLQLADIPSRKQRGDITGRSGITESTHPLHSVSHMDLDGIFNLTSLKKVLDIHNASGGSDAPQGKTDHSRWMHRPLPRDLVSYAENDIAIIARVYQIFSSRGYIRRNNQVLLEQQSARYVNMHPGPVPGNSPYHTSNLLPMDILDDPDLSSGRKKRCSKCKRVRGGKISVHPHCKVCNVLLVRSSKGRAGSAKRTNGAAQQPRRASTSYSIYFDDSFESYDDYGGYYYDEW